MDNTIKEATVNRYYHDNHRQLRQHRKHLLTPIVIFVEKDTFVCNSLPVISNFCLHKHAFLTTMTIQLCQKA
jgi:hypothetical protein